MLITKIMVKGSRKESFVSDCCIEMRDHENVEEKSANHNIIYQHPSCWLGWVAVSFGWGDNSYCVASTVQSSATGLVMLGKVDLLLITTGGFTWSFC